MQKTDVGMAGIGKVACEAMTRLLAAQHPEWQANLTFNEDGSAQAAEGHDEALAAWLKKPEGALHATGNQAHLKQEDVNGWDPVEVRNDVHNAEHTKRAIYSWVEEQRQSGRRGIIPDEEVATRFGISGMTAMFYRQELISKYGVPR